MLVQLKRSSTRALAFAAIDARREGSASSALTAVGQRA